MYFYVEYINDEITSRMCKFGDFAIINSEAEVFHGITNARPNIWN